MKGKKDMKKLYENDVVTCPICGDSTMEYKPIHGVNKQTEIWVCPECPAVLFEYWTDEDVIQLMEKLNGNR